MTLHYLDFDYSEDAEGTGTFDAMASATPAQLPALQAEIAQVLSWAHQEFPGTCAALEEGGLWQYDLQGMQETSTPLSLAFDPAHGRLDATQGTPGPVRTTLSLSVSGLPPFCAALREAFGLD